MGIVRNVAVRIGGDVSRMARAFRRGQEIASNFQSKIEKVGSGMQDFGTNLTAGVTAPIAGLGAVALTNTIKFEQSMSKVKAVTGETGKGFEDLSMKAREMGSKTSKSASEASEAMYYMGLAGWNNQQIMEGIEPVLRLAEAGNLDLARASDLVTDSMSALGLETKDLDVYLDSLAQTSRRSNTDIDMMAEAMIGVGGQFKNLRTPIAESSAWLGVLANRGIKASEAGTSLNSILINLTSGAGQAGDAMAEIGLSAFDAKGKFKGVSVVVKELRDKVKNFNDEKKLEILSKIGGKTQIDTLNALLAGVEEGTGEFDQLHQQIKNADGSLMSMVKTMQGNAMGQLNILKSSLEELSLQFGEVLLPYFKKFVSVIQNVVSAMNKLPMKAKQIMVVFALISAIIPPLIVAFGFVLSSITSIIGVFSAISLPIIGFVAGIGVLIAQIMAFVGVLAIMYKESDEFKTSINNLVGAVVERFVQFKNTLMDLKDWMIEFYNSNKIAIDKYIGLFINMASSLVNVLTALISGDIAKAMEEIGNYFSSAGKVIELVWGIIIDKASKYLKMLGKNILDELIIVKNNVVNYFKDIGNSMINELKNAIDSAKRDFETLSNFFIKLKDDVGLKIEEMWNNISTKFVAGVEKIKKFKDDLPNIILNMINNTTRNVEILAEAIPAKIEELTLRLEEKINNFSEKIITFTEAIPARIDEFVNNIILYLEKLPEKIEQITNDWTTKIEEFSNKTIIFVEELPGKIETFVNNIVKWFEELAEEAPKKIDSFVTKINERLEKAVEELPKKIEELVTKILEFLFNEEQNKKAEKKTKNMTKKVEKKIKEEKTPIVEAIKRLVKAILEALGTLAVKCTPLIVDMGVAIVKALGKAGIEILKAVASNIVEKVVEGLEDLYETGKTAGGKIISGLVDGITKNIKSLKDKAEEMARVIGNFFPKSPAKKGELRNIPKWGYKIIQQLRNSLTGQSPALKKTVDSISKTMTFEHIGLKKQAMNNIIKQFKIIEKNARDTTRKGMQIHKIRFNISELEKEKRTKGTTQKRIQAINNEIKKSKFEIEQLEILQRNNFVKKFTEDSQKYLEKFNTTLKNSIKNVMNKTQQIFNSYNLFEKVERKTISNLRLEHNLKTQVASMKEFKEQIETLRNKKIGDGLFEYFKTAGLSAVDQLRAVNKMTDEQLTNYSNLFGEKMQLSEDIAVSQLRLEGKQERRIDQMIFNITGNTITNENDIQRITDAISYNIKISGG